MTQEERWMAKYNEVKEFIEREHRNPSKYRLEEHDMLNWIKHNRKLFVAGELKPERIELFNRLIELMEENKHVNQYQ